MANTLNTEMVMSGLKRFLTAELEFENLISFCCTTP